MTNDHLTQFLESLKADTIHSMQAKGKMASGQTAQQIAITTEGDKAQLRLPGYMQALETGRAPTGPNALPGNPPMIDRIKDWCRAKGIPDKAAWAIKKSIDKHGYKGMPGILSEPLGDENINLRLNQITGDLGDNLVQQILGAINL